ncbi:hypothetical protein AGMMS49982_24190 [Bacteroidia bacterium]|nr:hypothetical protein AGMMS49982_24190 [Bacteroidia bacterium]
MNPKVIILILNTIYLIATIVWAIIDKSFEPVVAIIGGLVSFVTFFVINNNSFSVSNKQKIVQNGDNPISVVGDVKSSHIGHTT